MADAIKYVHPSEILVYSFDFEPLLPSTDTALSDIGEGNSLITAATAGGVDADNIISSAVRSGTQLRVTISGVVEGQEYLVTFLGEGATSGQRFVQTLEVRGRSKFSGEF